MDGDSSELTEINVDSEPDGEPPEDEPLVIDEDSANLVKSMMASKEGREALKEIADLTSKRFHTDFEGTEMYRERCTTLWRLFSGELPPKAFPWENCANAHVPILLENITRLCFRTEAEIFGDGANVFGVLPVGNDDEEVARILSTHGNWQIREKLKDFGRQQSRGVLMYYLHGDATSHSFWDPGLQLNRHEMLTPEEFVIPYTYVTTMPDYSDVPHRTKVIRKQKHELQKLRDVWFDVDKVIERRKPSFDDDPDESMSEAMADYYGIERSQDSDAAPYKLLWHEGWFDLPGERDQRFCQVILDDTTKAVLCLSIHEEVNWQDKVRFERQMAERSGYVDQLLEVQSGQAALDQGKAELAQVLSEGMMGAEQFQVAQQNLSQLEAAVSVQPTPPDWWGDPNDLEQMPKEPRRDPIHMFAHAVCIEPLVGNLGLSFGRIEADLNMAANTILSQTIDAATLANVASIITNGLEFESPLNLQPGAVNKVTGLPSGTIADNIYQLRFPPANPQMFDLLKMFQAWGSEAIQSPGVLSGAPGKSGETFRGLEARIEQATKQISVAARRYCNPFLKQILMNNARLNSIYMPEDEMFSVMNDERGARELLKVGRAMYQRDYRVVIHADLRFTSEAQKIQEADQLMEAMKLPQMQHNIPYLQTAMRKSLLARRRPDMVPYLGPQLPPPETPLGLPPPAPPMPPGGVPPQGGPPGPPGPPAPQQGMMNG